MSNTINSANMTMPIPVVGTDPGPQWARDINSCLTIIDQHNHSPGSGVPVPVSGIAINGDLPFANNNATGIRSVRFQSQNAALALVTDLGCLYEVNDDLFYNDGAGNQIQITQNGAVAGTPGSIANLTSPASASYVSANTAFVWQSAANTSAIMDAGSVIIRNATANSKGLTLAAPNAMGSDYTVTLPALPGSTSVLTINTGGTILSASYNDIGVGMTSVGANAIGASMSTAGAVAVATTAGLVTFFSSVGSLVTMTNSDGIRTVSMSPGVGILTPTVELPDAVANAGRIITVEKGSNASQTVIVTRKDGVLGGTQTLQGATFWNLDYQYESTTWQSDGVSNWNLIAYTPSAWQTWTPTISAVAPMGMTSTSIIYARFQKECKKVSFQMRATGTSTGTGSPYVTFTLPILAKNLASANANNLFHALFDLASGLNSGAAFVSTTRTLVQATRYDNANFAIGATIGIYCSGFYEID